MGLFGDASECCEDAVPIVTHAVRGGCHCPRCRSQADLRNVPSISNIPTSIPTLPMWLVKGSGQSCATGRQSVWGTVHNRFWLYPP